MMKRSFAFLFAALVLTCMLNPPTIIAGPILVDCIETDTRFMGIVGHGPITVNDMDNLGQYFTNVCGMTKWKVNWIVHEFEKNVNLPDEILFRPMTGTHMIAVPGHEPEDAPSGQNTRLPKIMYMASRGFRPIVIPGEPALHTFHADGVIGFLMPFSNDQDVLMYIAGLTIYHSSDPLIYFGTIFNVGSSQDSVIGGIVVASPDSNEVSLSLATFSNDRIERAVLNINGYDDGLKLDVDKFKTQEDRFTSYLEPELGLNEVKAEDLFNSGGTISIQAGNTEIIGVIRMEGEVDQKELLVKASKIVPANEDGSVQCIFVWIALALAIIALIMAFLGRRRSAV